MRRSWAAALLVMGAAWGCNGKDTRPDANKAEISRSFGLIEANRAAVDKLETRYSELNGSDSQFNARLRRVEIEQSRIASRDKPKRRVAWPPAGRDRGYAWADGAYPTGDPATSAIGIEKGLPREAAIGGELTYLLRVTNLSKNTLRSVVLEERLSANLTLVRSEPEGRAEGAAAVWQLGALNPGAAATVRVTARAGQGAAVETATRVSYDSALSGSIRLVDASMSVTKAQRAGGDGAWSEAALTLAGCGALSYRYTIENTGKSLLRGLRLEDPLSAGLSLADGGGAVSLKIGDLAAGEKRELVVQLEARQGGRFCSAAIAASSGGLTARSAELCTEVSGPTLSLALSCEARVGLDQPTAVKLTVKNAGEGASQDTLVELRLPPGVKVVKAEEGERAGGLLRFKLGELAAGRDRDFEAVLVFPKEGAAQLAGVARARCAAPAKAERAVEVVGVPVIVLEIEDVEDPIKVGEDELFIITASNKGSAAASKIKVEVVFESNWKFVDAGGASNYKSSGNQVVFDPVPTLAPGARAEWKVRVKGQTEGDARFAVTLKCEQRKDPLSQTESTSLVK